jgi:hypothetical protein
MQPVGVKMFRVSISSDAIGPRLQQPQGEHAADLQQYHAKCTIQNIRTCVPACNDTTHGYELLATVDGTDTRFSCNIANQLFSWVGAAALGGFLGHDVPAFVSALISGAAGTYVLALMGDADVGVDLTIEPGQSVVVSGERTLAVAPAWGAGAGFSVAEAGSLSLSYVLVEGALGAHGGVLRLDSCVLGGSEGVYDRHERTCVSAHNLLDDAVDAGADRSALMEGKTVSECAAMCVAMTTCVGFEYGVDYGGNTGNKPGHCMPSDSTDMTLCDGTVYNLDFYVVRAAPTPVTATAVSGASLAITKCSGVLTGLNVDAASTVSIESATFGAVELFGAIQLNNAGRLSLGANFAMVTDLAIGGGTQLELAGCTIPPHMTMAVSGGGSLSLAEFTLPYAVLTNAYSQLAGVGSILSFSSVTVPVKQDVKQGTVTSEGVYDKHERACVSGHNLIGGEGKTVSECAAMCATTPTCVGFEYGVDYGGNIGAVKPGHCIPSDSTDMTLCDGGRRNLDFYVLRAAPTLLWDLTGSITVGDNGKWRIEPLGLGVMEAPFFTVVFGPCVATEDGRCFGRPDGYGPQEVCEVAVGGAGGVLGPCSVFDLYGGGDAVTTTDGVVYRESDCPVGAMLPPGGTVRWISNGQWQGSTGNLDNGCAAKGFCGLPYSDRALGGGWDICFA